VNTSGLDDTTQRDWIARVAMERARLAPPAGFPTLPDIPAGRYIDADFFALERSAVWQRTWLYAAHFDQLPTAGSFLVWSHGSAPILLMRGDDGEIRAFYNTCRHRGAPLARTVDGRAGAVLVCGYHGWSYDRQGRLRARTEARDWSTPDTACHDLVSVRCERFGNWIFICEDANAEPLSAFLEPVTRYLQHLPLTELRLVSRREIEVRSHVKVLIENFLEAYHFKLLHQHTTDRIFDSQGTSVHLWRNGHSMMLSPNRREGWIDPGTVGMPEMATSTAIERHHNPSYCLFPNLIMPLSPTGTPTVAIWPKTLRTSVLEVLWFAPDWGDGPRDPLWDTRIANFDRIVDEDIQFAEPMQETIESPGFRGVPLCYQERRIYHWHEELDRRIGVERVPEALRVAPCLGPFVE
jgi:nitrite reductase/ring-hydroxylating ferredoxin subunit